MHAFHDGVEVRRTFSSCCFVAAFCVLPLNLLAETAHKHESKASHLTGVAKEREYFMSATAYGADKDSFQTGTVS